MTVRELILALQELPESAMDKQVLIQDAYRGEWNSIDKVEDINMPVGVWLQVRAS